MALQCDLTLAHCNIFYEYSYMRLLLGGGYILFPLTYDPVASIQGRLLFFANSRSVQRLFDGGYYLKCGIYLRNTVLKYFCGNLGLVCPCLSRRWLF